LKRICWRIPGVVSAKRDFHSADPVSQASQCPKCRVTDITMRYIRIRNVAGVLVIATPLAMESKGGGSAADGGRISVHDLIADNVHEKDYKGGGAFLKYASSKVAVHDVQIDHVTSIGPAPSLPSSVAGTKCPTSASSTACLPWRHSPPGQLRRSGELFEKQPSVQAALNACFSNYKFDHNLISVERLSGGWPPENTIVASPEDLGVHDLKDGISSDPRLCHEKALLSQEVSRRRRSLRWPRFGSRC